MRRTSVRLAVRLVCLGVALPLATARIRPAERDALWHLYENTDGATWEEAENWLPSNDACRKTRAKVPNRAPSDAPLAFKEGEYFEPTPWHGVGCVDPCDDYLDGPGCTAGRVLSLRLRANGLRGSIGGWTGVGEMRNITHIDLSYNDLTGNVPTQLGLINNLDVLQLRNNQLEGDLPAELADVNGNGVGKLREVSLANNQLRGHVPPSFAAHRDSLLYFDVGNNSLSGTLPASYVAELPKLQVLYLRNNSMSGTVPAELGANGGLAGLMYLEAQGNARLSGTLPTTIGASTELYTLDLMEDRISGTLPTELGLLTELRFLRLNDNSFSGTIPTELGELRDLEVLDLYNNQLEGDMPSELGQLINLRLMYLPNEQLLPLRMRYCQHRMPSLGKYSYRLVREEYYRMISSICPEPYDTLSAFGTLSQISGDV